MRKTRFIPVLAIVLLALPATAHARPAPDLPEVRRIVTLEVASGDWSGRVAVGLVTSGSGASRVTRPLHIELDLARESCDVAGCVRTTLSIPASAAAVAMPRMAAQFTSASLDPVLVGMVVRRSVPGGAVMEHATVVSLSMRARRSGPVSRETSLRQGSDGETLTVSLMAPMAATIFLGDDTLGALGSAVKASIVR